MGEKTCGPPNNIILMRSTLKNLETYWARGTLSVHENCPYASEAKDLVTGPSSLCVSMCALIYMVIVSVACSTGTCYKNTGKHLLHSTAIYLSQQLPWSGLTNGHKEEEKSSNPQGTIEERDERDRSGGEGEAEWRESSLNKRETGYIQKAQHNMYLTCLVRVGWVNLTGIDFYFHTAAKKHASHETIIKPSFSGLI